MSQAMSCPLETDIASISTLYAQMTGVLAGLTFTAMVVLMTPTQVVERESKGFGRRDDRVLQVLLAAFIALLFATLTYAVAAGSDPTANKVDPEVAGRAATSELIDGLPFGLAAMMLFHGVSLLMENSAVSRVPVWTARAMTVVVVPGIAFSYLVSGTQDTVAARGGLTLAQCKTPPLPEPGPTLSWVLPAMLGVALILRLRPVLWRRPAYRIQAAVPVIVLVVSAGAAVFSGILSVRTPAFLFSPTAITAYLVSTFGLFTALGIMLSLGYAPLKSVVADPAETAGTAEAARRSAVAGVAIVLTIAGMAAALRRARQR